MLQEINKSITIFNNYINGEDQPPESWGNQENLIKTVYKVFGDSKKFRVIVTMIPWGELRYGTCDVIDVNIDVFYYNPSDDTTIGESFFEYQATLYNATPDLKGYCLGEQALRVVDREYFNMVDKAL